ncbi:MAG: hypothetical protein IBX55_00475 [Methyloprofundus sp.]|nr:hypothetical protein [Methyloprofundus sp.]
MALPVNTTCHCVDRLINDFGQKPYFVKASFPRRWDIEPGKNRSNEALTASLFTVIQDGRNYHVFFDKDLGYTVRRPNDRFFKDIEAGLIANKSKYQDLYSPGFFKFQIDLKVAKHLYSEGVELEIDRIDCSKSVKVNGGSFSVFYLKGYRQVVDQIGMPVKDGLTSDGFLSNRINYILDLLDFLDI